MTWLRDNNTHINKKEMGGNCPDDSVVISKELLITLYNNAYNAGHEDTVESQYTFILPCDIAEYHSDIVDEWLDEHL